jgi:hypothetical protein
LGAVAGASGRLPSADGDAGTEAIGAGGLEINGVNVGWETAMTFEE